MFFNNDSYKEQQKMEQALMGKWSDALNANGGISNEHMARQTAVCCENYLRELKNDPRLIAEERVQTGAFKGVNLALLGLITRTIPNLVGAELVGVQAMPTPKAPVFTMTWHKSDTKGLTTGNTAGFPNLPDGDEMWVSPIPTKYGEFGGVDPDYSSNIVREKYARASVTAVMALEWTKKLKKMVTKGYLYPESIVVYFLNESAALKDFGTYGEDTNIMARGYITGAVSGGKYVMALSTMAGVAVTPDVTFLYDPENQEIEGLILTIAAIETAVAGADTVGNVIFEYQYDAEAEGKMPEIEFKITEESIGLTRRQLRGKYTADASQDVRVFHGINLESELVNMMKNELMHETNHEIITDLRKMAKLVKTLNFNKFLVAVPVNGASTQGNYDDAAKLALDAINRIAAEIWIYGRLGYGNWVVGNPATLSYLDRVPGFVGSGVTYSGRDLSFAGSVGGKMKIYHDPTFPQDELLIGLKGSSALETGYLYCPYLPITATPTLYDPETGDPSKIFYTRYGKTLKENGAGLSVPKSVILNGEYQYARLKLVGNPGSLLFS